jgi:ribose-phosphate pyrophosphokinase
VLPSSTDLKLFSGTANPKLAYEIAKALGVRLGDAIVGRFPDGEIKVQLGESVRGNDVYIIQPTCPPVNDNLMELLTLVDAVRRSSAGRINAVIPYFGYARQDKQVAGREPITAKLVSTLLEAAGVERVITIDLHSRQLQGFFDIPLDMLSALRTIASHLRSGGLEDTVIVSPDTGRSEEARRLTELLGLPLAFMYKRRTSERDTQVTAVIGDVVGKRVILVDDVISTGGTLRRAVEALIQAGARPDVRIAATHAVLAGDARERLAHPAIKELIVTDTIPLGLEDHYTVLSVAPLLASAIAHVNQHKSVSALI